MARLARGRGARWRAGYAALTANPPADSLVGRESTRLGGAERLAEPFQIRALALAEDSTSWLLIRLEASLLDVATAGAIERRLAEFASAATVVASGHRAAPVLSELGDRGAWRRQVIELAVAAGRSAVARLAPASLGFRSAPVEFTEAGSFESLERLPYVDALEVAAGPGRPQVILAVASIPRLVDPYRGLAAPSVWGRAERTLTALLGEPVALLGLSATGAQESAEALQRAGSEPLVAGRLAAAMAAAVQGPREPVGGPLRLESLPTEVETLPCPERYALRQAADQAEIGCEDGTLSQRTERIGRWEWLERVYAASAEGRTLRLTIPLQRITLGQVVLLALGADASEPAAASIVEQQAGEVVLLVSGAGGRAAALVGQPERAELTGGRELESLCDLWPIAGTACGAIARALVEPAEGFT